MERILFGDNQFFGVNHMSEEKSRAQATQFKDTSAIMRVLDSAYDCGIKVFMCTTHDRVGDIADIVRRIPSATPTSNSTHACRTRTNTRIRWVKWASSAPFAALPPEAW